MRDTCTAVFSVENVPFWEYVELERRKKEEEKKATDRYIRIAPNIPYSPARDHLRAKLDSKHGQIGPAILVQSLVILRLFAVSRSTCTLNPRQ